MFKALVVSILATAGLVGCSGSSDIAGSQSSAARKAEPINTRALDEISNSSLSGNSTDSGSESGATTSPVANPQAQSSQKDDDSMDKSLKSALWFGGSLAVIGATILITDAVTGGDVLGIFGPGKDKKNEAKLSSNQQDPDCDPSTGVVSDVNQAKAITDQAATSK